MQQVSANTGLQGPQGQGSVSSHSARSAGEPPQSSRATPARPKKRGRNDTSSDSGAKQHRIDSDGGLSGEKDNCFKSGASGLVGKDGGISSVEHVERFVSIMGCEWNDNAERQLDLVVSRTMLAKVVATTTDRKCLVLFLKMGGLAILDKWLQEAHTGKLFVNREIVAGSEKAVQDLVLALLGALEVLPVDLSFLRACPVGKSLNLLRNHKHHEVQTRVKRLAETWKGRIASEMNQKMGIFHQQDDGITSSETLAVAYPELSASHGSFTGGRGERAPKESLCLSSENYHMSPAAGSALLSGGFLRDDPRMVALPDHLLSDIHKAECCRLSQQFGAFSSNRDDGRTYSSETPTLVPKQLSFDQFRGFQSTATPQSRNSASACGVQSCSTVDPVSELMDATKESPVYASRLYAAPQQSGVFFPYCSSAVNSLQGSAISGGLSSSSLISLPRAGACGGLPSFPDYMPAELSKGGIHHVANTAASEGSVVQVRPSDSLSNRSVGMNAGLGALMESCLPNLQRAKCAGMVLPKPVNKMLEGEQFDQFSSNVSSPSETSVNADTRVSTLETSDPNANVGKEVMRKLSASMGGPSGMQPIIGDMKVGLLRPCPAETVGENQGYVKANRMDMGEADCPRQQRNRHPCSMEVVDAVVDHKEVISCHGSSVRWSFEGNPFCGEFSLVADNRLKNPAQNDHFAYERGSGPIHAIDRPIFDLNEVVKDEDGFPVTSGCAVASPLQNCGAMPTFSAPDLKIGVTITPTAPIAVMAAAKGSFTLPNVAQLPKGETGWKGSAPTSAFRRAQPQHDCHKANVTEAKQRSYMKEVMDFDLNVAAPGSGCLDNSLDLRSSMASVPLVKRNLSASMLGNATPVQKGQIGRQPGGAWDLNQVGDMEESKVRRDLDLNCGPMGQDEDDDILANKYIGIKQPLVFDNTMSVASTSGGCSYPLKSIAPIMIPACTMSNSGLPCPVEAAAPWSNSGPPNGMLHYNVLLQNPRGMACPALSSLPAGSYGYMPHGFPSASMKNFSAPFTNTTQDHHPRSRNAPILSVDQSSLLSQTRSSLPCMMDMVADAIHDHGEGGFWSRPHLDLNAGPDRSDANNVKDRQHMLWANEQMRARHPVSDTPTTLNQRDQDGLPLGIQGVCLKQSVWR